MKSTNLIISLVIGLLFISCDKEETIETEKSIPSKVVLHFSYDEGKTFEGQYEGVRIGEYYWMNSNFCHRWGYNVERSDIEKIFHIYGHDISEFTVSMEDFNKYYGSYFSRPALEKIVEYGRMYENEEEKPKKEWQLPSVRDFQQLFGMCGNAKVDAVMNFLACKEWDNPGAVFIKGSSWVGGFNRNIYGFNLLPTGAIFNGPGTWKPYPAGEVLEVNEGDMYGLYQAVLFPVHDAITVSIHDYVDTRGGKLWHYLPMRWCRKLSDEELGYKLYINSDQTDIIKRDINLPAPVGYKELLNGYLRGFYVQYILDKEKPEKTIKEIVEMSKNLR